MARTLRVGLDLAPLAGGGSQGLRRVAAGASAALVALAREGVTVVPLIPPPGRALRLWRHLDVPRLAAREDLDGVHAFTSGFALSGPGWRTSTVHELPWRHGERENAGFMHRAWARLGVRHAARVLTASARVARELADEAPHAAARVRVVPWGVEEVFLRAQPDLALCGALGIAPGFVLVPGGARAKKRLAAVLAAAARMRPPPIVVASGGPSVELARCHDFARACGVRLVAVGELDEARWPGLVAAAGAVLAIAPSEGFALPVLEALAAGVAPVVAQGGVADDVAAGHAELADAGDADELAAAIERALARPPSARAAGRAHAAAFTWQRTADGLADVFEELA